MSNTLTEPQLAIAPMPQDLPYNLGHLALTKLGGGSKESFAYDQIIRQTQELEESSSVGAHLVPIYLAAMDESPGARSTFLSLASVYEDPSMRNSPGVASQFGEWEDKVTVAKGWGPYKRFLRRRSTSAEIIAERLGIAKEDLTPEKMASFNLAHELGHVDHKSQMGDGPFELQRKDEMKTLPVPDKPPGELMSYLRTPKGVMFWRNNKEKFEAAGIHSRKQLISAQERAYKFLPTEAYADEFAVKVLARLEAAKAKADTEIIQN